MQTAARAPLCSFLSGTYDGKRRRCPTSREEASREDVPGQPARTLFNGALFFWKQILCAFLHLFVIAGGDKLLNKHLKATGDLSSSNRGRMLNIRL